MMSYYSPGNTAMFATVNRKSKYALIKRMN